tara:strand:- start:869 stop:1594 length:726 start_codon:yes stop_codon:yes gene_type:complete
MMRNLLEKAIARYVFLAILLLFLIIIYQTFDITLINNLFTDGQDSLTHKGIYILLLIFLLRSISIFIPVIPGTYCVVIAGYIYGIEKGLLIMFFADFFSCYTSFLISRRLGRGFVKKLLGPKQMERIENISKKYLEQNIFLMTGFLMTSWFDFVCYAVGFTKISWRKFMPALVVSILISDIPFIAGGHTLSQLKDVTFSQVLNGEVAVIKGPYLFILIISALIIFGIGLLNALIKKRTKFN